MKRLLLALLILSAAAAQAQFRWDYGLKLGTANYLGDIGGKNLQRRDYFWDMHLGETRYAVGIFGRYKYNKRFAVSGNLDHFLIQDADRFTTY
ncbi:MAG: outer membrane beta-barrel protein, partial [Flavobacteriales bacterium]